MRTLDLQRIPAGGGVRCCNCVYIARSTAMYSHNIETSPHGCLAAVQKFPFHVSVFNNHQHTQVTAYMYIQSTGIPASQKTICDGIYARVYCILVRVQCRRKESSRSLSHLLMSFLFLPMYYTRLIISCVLR